MPHIALATCRALPAWEIDDRPLVEALQGHGATVETPAWDDPAAGWGRFDAVLIRTTWDYVPRLGEYLAWAEAVERAGTPLVNPAAVVRWNTHKGYLRELSRAGVPIIPTCWLARGAAVDLHQRVRALQAERAFLKPVVGAGASDTLRFTTDPDGLEAATAFSREQLERQEMMLQPYLEKVETFGEVSAIFVGGRLCHGVRKVPVSGDYRVQDDFGATDEPYSFEGEEARRAHQVMAAAAACLGLEGPAELLYGRADFLADAGGDLLLTELELVEPSLFFRHGGATAGALAAGLLRSLHGKRPSRGV